MPQTNQTITNFYQQGQARDFSRSNLFRVLNVNFGLNGGGQALSENDLVYARTASLPARSITNIPVPYMGLNFNVPGVATYPGSDSYTINFYADEAQTLRQRFLDVSRATFDDATSSGNYFIPGQEAVIDLVQLDKQLNVVSQYQLVGVSIRDVAALAYDITSTGEVQNFDVTVAYHYYNQSKTSDPVTPRGVGNQISGVLRGAANRAVANAIQSITPRF